MEKIINTDPKEFMMRKNVGVVDNTVIGSGIAGLSTLLELVEDAILQDEGSKRQINHVYKHDFGARKHLLKLTNDMVDLLKEKLGKEFVESNRALTRIGGRNGFYTIPMNKLEEMFDEKIK